MNLVDFCLRRNRGSKFEQEMNNVELLIVRDLVPRSINTRAPVFFGAMGHAWARQMQNAVSFGVLSKSDKDFIVGRIIELLKDGEE